MTNQDIKLTVGGTVQAAEGTYLKRPADDKLFQACLRNEFSHVLSCRQIGKSSLMIATAERLKAQGARVGIIDLNGVGKNVSEDEMWYFSLLDKLAGNLKLQTNFAEWWAAQSRFSTLTHRFILFFEKMILKEIEGNIIIFIDEIDATFGLPFADDFFAALRTIYNDRAQYPAYKRLTFVLLGVATPDELISDKNRSPFNIGQAIHMRDFTKEECQKLHLVIKAKHPSRSNTYFEQIYDWTNGHPYLTQKLCTAVADASQTDESDFIKNLVQVTFQEDDDHNHNITFVKTRVLDDSDIQQMLRIYQKVLQGKTVRDDDKSQAMNRLKLYGLVTVSNKNLETRNNIYSLVFNEKWINENLLKSINWRSIALKFSGGSTILVVIFVAIMITYNLWLNSQFESVQNEFHQAETSQERLNDLAKIFEMQGIFNSTDYDGEARSLFYNLSEEQQLSLFQSENIASSDLTVVIEGLYMNLIEQEDTKKAARLFKEMDDALVRTTKTETTRNLKQEMARWLLEVEQENPSSEFVRVALPSTTARILARGVLRAGVKYDFNPFGYLDEDEKIVGFDVDIVREFAKRWLGDENAVKFTQVTPSDRIPLLTSGEVDLLAASMTHTRERDQEIDFSQTYFLDSQQLLVHQDSNLDSVSDLAGKRVAVIEGTTSFEAIQKKAEMLSIEIFSFQTPPAAIEALKNGAVDAFTTDSVVLFQLVKENPQLKVVGESLKSEPYGIGVPQGDSDFLEFVNVTLQEMKDDGTYDDIYQKWFSEQAPYPIEMLPGEAPYLTLADLPLLLAPLERSGIEAIESRGKIVAAVKKDFKPFGYLDQNGNHIGFDVDIVRELAKRWLGDENAVELIPVISSDRIPRLVSGEVDLVMASMTHTRDRDQKIDFSQTYFLDGQSLLVRRNSDIDTVADLNGKKVAVIAGSTAFQNIQQEAKRLEVSLEAVPFESHPQAVEALKNKAVDAFTTDQAALSEFAKENPELEVVGEPFTKEPYGIGIPKNDFRLRELVNFTLQEMKNDETYDTIYKKWFSDREPYPIEIWPTNAMTISLTSLTCPSNMILIQSLELCLDIHEVSNDMHQQCIVQGDCTPPKTFRSLTRQDYYYNSEFQNYPVINISWNQAETFCRFAGKRLPTAVDWTEAADYSSPPDELLTAPNDTLPVSESQDKTPEGVYNLAGNVKEWVADSEGILKLVKGKSFNSHPSDPIGYLPDTATWDIGFRCAIDLQ